MLHKDLPTNKIMISKEKISNWKENYNKKDKILENVISNNSIANLSIVRSKCQNFNPVYNVNVTPHLKVTWPTGKETLQGTLMVAAMAIIASIFFLLLDQLFQFILGIILKIGF